MRAGLRREAGWILAVIAGAITAVAAEPDFSRWEKDISAFEARDRTNPPPKGAVLFVGSSSIRMWTNLAADFPNLQVINRGFGGSVIEDTTHFADRIIFPHQPTKIVLYAGDNDIARGYSAERVLQDFKALVEKIQTKLPEAKVYYLAIKPSPSRWHLSPQSAEANRLIRKQCRFNSKLEYIDVWTPLMKDGQPDPAFFLNDRLHLNRAGYERWAKVVRAALAD
jgi:lysophospholipase L1-like esterase